jgi:hypothetical protein
MKDSVKVQSYPIMLKPAITFVSPVIAPLGFGLSDNYPNPFNPTTVIRYVIPKYGIVTLKIYDALGREVETLVNRFQGLGSYELTFDGSFLPSGMYFYRLIAGGFSVTKKMSLVK